MKLADVINWSWWWVTAPLWVAGLIIVAIITVAILANGVRRRRKGP